MKRLMILVELFFLAGLLTGCATKITAVRETYNEISVALDTGSGDSYYLYVNNMRQYNSSSGSNGQLIFSAPSSISPRDCLSVRNKSGDIIQMASGASQYFQVQLPVKFSALQTERYDIEQKRQGLSSQYAGVTQAISQANSELGSNRAYMSSQCKLPPQRALPNPPNTRCTSRSKCIADANQICFAIAFGAEGCGMALAKENISGVISGPACGLIAAKLAKEEYGMGDAVADAIRGVVDDAADSMMKDDSFFMKLFGLAVKGVNYVSKLQAVEECRGSFVARNYEPYETWLGRVENIKAEPMQLLSKCRNSFSMVNYNKEKKETLERDYAALGAELGNVNEKILTIKGKRYNAKIGCSY